MADALTTDSKAPPFKLPRDGGGEVALADYRGRKLVLYFYPKADTTGCTREATDFTALSREFAAADTAVLGASADPIPALDRFKAKHKLGIILASDPSHAVIAAYGAWGKKTMYGRSYEGVLRSTFLIDTEGKIVRIWRNVRVPGHAEEVFAAAKAL